MTLAAALAGALILCGVACSSAPPEQFSPWAPAPPVRGLMKDSYFKSTIIHTSGQAPLTFEGSTIDDSFIFMQDGGLRGRGAPGAPDGAPGNDLYIHNTPIIEGK